MKNRRPRNPSKSGYTGHPVDLKIAHPRRWTPIEINLHLIQHHCSCGRSFVAPGAKLFIREATPSTNGSAMTRLRNLEDHVDSDRYRGLPRRVVACTASLDYCHICFPTSTTARPPAGLDLRIIGGNLAAEAAQAVPARAAPLPESLLGDKWS